MSPTPPRTPPLPVVEVGIDPAIGQTNPLDTILMTTSGYCVARALQVVADLAVADFVGELPCPIDDVARSSGTNADALGRVLALLSAHGIFSVDGPSVAHNDASRLLRTDHPQSARDLARMFGLPFFWETFQELEHTVRTGRPATEKAHPEGSWAWLSARPDANAVFNGAMAGKSFGQVAGVIECFDFSRFGRIADIGGGRGHLLHAILDKWPSASGVLFDLPHVIAEASAPEHGRMQLQAGDFFEDELPACDAYVLMEVIHDWADDQAGRILSAVARAARPGAGLLIVEQLMPDSGDPHWARMLDIHMMALFAARQRSSDEYDALARRAGFRRVGTVDTPAGISILEYRRD